MPAATKSRLAHRHGRRRRNPAELVVMGANPSPELLVMGANPRVLLRDVKDAERSYASAVEIYGPNNMETQRREFRWRDLQRKYEAQSGKPLYRINPADTMSEAIALSSPSGRMSKRARRAAERRLSHALFGPGGLPAPQSPQPKRSESLRREAKQLRDLAARGMKPRAYAKRADQLEAQARDAEMRGNPDIDRNEITRLWHISRTALAGGDDGRYARLLYVAREYHKAHPEVSSTAAYKFADQSTRVFNPSQGEQASELYERFHGRPSQHVDEYHEPTPRPGTLTELGDLIELRVKCDAGYKWRSLDFTRFGEGLVPDSGIKVASNAAGTQIYFIGGTQRIGALAPFAADRSKDLIDLGECVYISYRTRKDQVNGKQSNYEHFLGEETHVYPRLMYDKRGKQPRIFFVGGAYRVEGQGIVN